MTITQFGRGYVHEMTGSFLSKCMFCWLSCKVSFSLKWLGQSDVFWECLGSQLSFQEERNERAEKNRGKTGAILTGCQIHLTLSYLQSFLELSVGQRTTLWWLSTDIFVVRLNLAQPSCCVVAKGWDPEKNQKEGERCSASPLWFPWGSKQQD